MIHTTIPLRCLAALIALTSVCSWAHEGGLSVQQFFGDASGGDSANLGANDVKIASGVVNNNVEEHWMLTITSANNGRLVRTVAPMSEIPYTNIHFVKTGGTLGTGLMDPSGAGKSVASGTCFFTTGLQPATSETVDYAFELRISWTADRTLVAGTYADTITITYAAHDD